MSPLRSLILNKLLAHYIIWSLTLTLAYALLQNSALVFMDIILPLNTIEMLALTCGYSALYYSFKLIKEGLVLYWIHVPIILIALILPSLFNIKLINLLFNQYINNTLLTSLIFLVLSILGNYFVLNRSVLKGGVLDE
ncbi:MAG: hypothetical protein ACRCTA_02555 [Bacilli bacterium]